MPPIPDSTYRLQLHAGFTFDDASAIADYLSDLGVSHVYCSPYLQAAPGSMHGYDVVDPQAVNKGLGGAEAHERFCKRLGEQNLGQVLDIVPNHMSLVKDNRFWWDVLENGQSSRFASYFDIDWKPSEVRLQDKVLVPILGDQYGRVLSSGDIKVIRHVSRFRVQYADHLLPISPQSIPGILTRAAKYASFDALSFMADSYARLPSPDYEDRPVILGRHRDKVVLNSLLERLCIEEPAAAAALDHAISDINGDVDVLDELLNQQHYRLAYWRTADQQLSYRRFFDVNSLIGLRMEREHVFAETHELIARWLKEGVIDGVRVDHPDGLRDPMQYFERLRKIAPHAWIVGEKILEPGEFLRESWPIDGTSGYDFLNVANGVLVRPEGLMQLDHIYEEFTHESTDYREICHDKKLNVTQEALGSDVNLLTTMFVEICEGNRDRRDYTRAEVRRAIREVAACFPIYRTYAVAERNEIIDEDVEYIRRATEDAKQRRQDIDGGLFDFLGDVLTLGVRGPREAEFVMRFQQFTSPVMAKGVEDTAFYNYNRLIGLNEVGGDPGLPGVSVREFHDYCERMHATFPRTMVTLSTHDTKRSDDVRARLAVLSEDPKWFQDALKRWSRTNRIFRTNGFPDPNTEYFYYQTLIGAWPLSMDRALAYMEKAVREAKSQTSWTSNNQEFEDALRRFIRCTLEYEPFLNELERFVAKILPAGRINSLAQTLLKHTVPGIPDTYQGSELWDLSLVDPDNRRPVDYAVRRRLLAELKNSSISEISDRSDEGSAKMWTIHRALTVRRARAASFGEQGGYFPLYDEGAESENFLGFRRGDDVITMVTRLPLSLKRGWGSTTVDIPHGRWLNQMTNQIIDGGIVKLKNIFEKFPVALLTLES